MKNIHHKHVLFLLMTLLGVSQWVRAEVAVVVHPSVALDAISQDEMASLFLAKTDTLPNGVKMLPVDQKDDQPVRAEFNEKIVRKDADQLDAYWSRLIFTGKGEPPKKLSGNAEVIAMVAANPNVIGYVDASAVTGDVKVLLKVP